MIGIEKSVQRLGMLDALKGICCILVCLLHCPFPGRTGLVIQNIAGISVPIFFIIAGYGASGNKDNYSEHRNRHIARNFFLTILVICFYGAIMILRIKIININSNTLLRTLYLNDIDFTGAGHMWFSLALVYCYVLYTYLSRFNNYVKIGLATFLLSFNVGIRFFDSFEWHMVGNWLLYGIPFFLIGDLINDNICLIRKRITNKFCYKVMLLCMAVSLLGVIYPVYNLYMIGNLLLPVVCVVHAILAEKSWKSFEILGKKYSILIYSFHPFFIEVLNSLERRWTLLSNKMLWNYMKPIFVIYLTFLFAVLFVYIINIIKRIFKVRINTS